MSTSIFRKLLAMMPRGGLLALVLLAVLELVMRVFAHQLPEPVHWHSSQLQYMLRNLEANKEGMDTMIVGTSAAGVVDVSLLPADSRWFNAAIAGASMGAIAPLVSDVVLARAAPRRVLILAEPNAFTTESPQVKRTDGYFLRSNGYLKSTGTMQERLLAGLKTNLRMLSYSDNFTALLRGGRPAPVKAADPEAAKEARRQGNNLIIERLGWLDRSESGYTALDSLLEKLERLGVLASVVVLPLSDELRATAGEKGLRVFKTRLREMTVRRNARFVDMDAEPSFRNQDQFSDIIHFNEKGKKAVTSYLYGMKQMEGDTFQGVAGR